MPVFLFDVLDPAQPLSPGEAAFTGFAQWVVLHDSQHEASAAIARHLPKATATRVVGSTLRGSPRCNSSRANRAFTSKLGQRVKVLHERAVNLRNPPSITVDCQSSHVHLIAVLSSLGVYQNSSATLLVKNA